MAELNETDTKSDNNQNCPEISGLLVSYKDDEINECIHSALQGKRRVYYKCMDVYSNFIAFGTSVGAIYLFRLTTITHAACKLALVIPCDQGSIDIIKFLPGSFQSDDLLVAIGTSRGSLVIFQLSCLDEQNIRPHELYRAEEFTKSMHESSVGIKMIEYDLNFVDTYSPTQANPNCSFSRVYVCDQRDRIFVLESSSIYPTFRLLYSNKPSHVLSVNDSTIHQICVHRSRLLMSTDEKTRIFSEHSNELVTIGKKQRKTKGFFGACFFNPNYKPPRMMQHSLARSCGNISSSQQTIYSSAGSLVETDNLLTFVARPRFSLWQVNAKREVMFTHIFDSSLRKKPPSQAIEIHNARIESIELDDFEEIESALNQSTNDYTNEGPTRGPKSDHFEKLLPIFSTTLGNLLLSYSKFEIFVIDPIGARLIVWYRHEKPIMQLCCNENEIFVLSELNRHQFKVTRLILLAPTQFVLELHRINRFLSLMTFVQMFCEQMRLLMTLPINGPGIITTEGGLLRNIIWNTWRECSDFEENSEQSSLEALNEQDGQVKMAPRTRLNLERFGQFKEIVQDILDESRQLKQSIVNLNDSQLFFTVSNENIERLCSEPYASMVSLDISIANLHTNHVVHFSQEALQRHKSLAKLSQSIMNLNKLKLASTRSSFMNENNGRVLASSTLDIAENDLTLDLDDKRVVVEQLKPKNLTKSETDKSKNIFSAIHEQQENQQPTPTEEGGSKSINRLTEIKQLDVPQPQVIQLSVEQKETSDPNRCHNCNWPKPRAHLKPMHHSQQIQHNWIQENLVPNFNEHVEQIEERAFKHGLWHLVLRCYASKHQLEDYITCCLMLDDVRLLNLERFDSLKCSEAELIDLTLNQLKLKLNQILAQKDTCKDFTTGADMSYCFKCHEVFDTKDVNNKDDSLIDEDQSLGSSSYDEDDIISFSLVNLVRRLVLRKNSDIKPMIQKLLQHPDLLNMSRIPADFYLQVIANQCATIRRTRLKV